MMVVICTRNAEMVAEKCAYTFLTSLSMKASAVSLCYCHCLSYSRPRSNYSYMTGNYLPHKNLSARVDDSGPRMKRLEQAMQSRA